MTVLAPIKCPKCHNIKSVTKYGKAANGKQRFYCYSEACTKKAFIINHDKKGWLPETKEKVIEMALNGSGIRDTARVLGISTATVMSVLKKRKVSKVGKSQIIRAA